MGFQRIVKSRSEFQGSTLNQGCNLHEVCNISYVMLCKVYRHQADRRTKLETVAHTCYLQDVSVGRLGNVKPLNSKSKLLSLYQKVRTNVLVLIFIKKPQTLTHKRFFKTKCSNRKFQTNTKTVGDWDFTTLMVLLT